MPAALTRHEETILMKMPRTCVDWCDARAYCEWAGKRLCGAIGGGPSAFADRQNATRNEWFNACSEGALLTYPYGITFDASACFLPWSANVTVAVASYAGCVGGYPGIYDMVGNAFEWTDSCSGTAGARDTCVYRGSETSPSSRERLNCAGGVEVPRSYDSTVTGFRCCSD
jgi:formylglycine-generating enzyme required for sulfatase activity